MFIIYALVLGILFGYLKGGRLQNLTKNPLHMKGLAVLALMIQIVIFSDFSILSSISAFWNIVLHYISYGLLVLFVFFNRSNLGIITMGIGIFLNALVIIFNNGYMPSLPENLQNTSMNKFAESLSQGNAVHNSAAMSSHTRFPWLGDVFVLPSWLPFSNVFSIGDLLLGVGVCWYLASSMKAPRPRSS